MNMTEGNTTLNVPELRRLLEEARKAKAAWDAAMATGGPPLDADFGGEMSDDDDRAFQRWLDADSRLSVALYKAGPALLNAIEAVERYRTLFFPADEDARLTAFGEAMKELDAAMAPLFPAKAGPS